MKELEQILILHAARYPEMEPTDAVKLIYQNEFGGGHLLRDEETARRFLCREYETVEKNPSGIRYEAIGNGFLRIHLAALKEDQLADLFRSFAASAAEHRGNQDRFREKLEELRHLAEAGVFAFDSAALESYLTEYEAAGFPMVSHSPAYRKAYCPAYRIVREDFWN